MTLFVRFLLAVFECDGRMEFPGNAVTNIHTVVRD